MNGQNILGTSIVFTAITKDEADLWKDMERYAGYWLSGKRKLYSNIYDSSLLVLKNDILTNINKNA